MDEYAIYGYTGGVITLGDIEDVTNSALRTLVRAHLRSRDTGFDDCRNVLQHLGARGSGHCERTHAARDQIDKACGRTLVVRLHAREIEGQIANCPANRRGAPDACRPPRVSAGLQAPESDHVFVDAARGPHRLLAALGVVQVDLRLVGKPGFVNSTAVEQAVSMRTNSSTVGFMMFLSDRGK